MNPFAAWKGHSETRKKAINMLPENQLSLFGIDGEDHKIREHKEIKSGSPSYEMKKDNTEKIIENNRDTSFDLPESPNLEDLINQEESKGDIDDAIAEILGD